MLKYNFYKALIYLFFIIFSSCPCFAGLRFVPVEIKCSTMFLDAKWVTFDGNSNTQYTLTTEGIRENGNSIIEEVIQVGNNNQTRGGLHVHIEAKCLPSGSKAKISKTGSCLECKLGEGIKVLMLEPSDENPERYHYVGSLKISDNTIKDDEIIQESPPSESEVFRQKKSSGGFLGGNWLLRFRGSSSQASMQ